MLDLAAPKRLAACRRAGTLARVRLQDIASRAEAEAFQVEAIQALGGELAATKSAQQTAKCSTCCSAGSRFTRRFCASTCWRAARRFCFAPASWASNAEFGFVMGRDFPAANEEADIDAAWSAPIAALQRVPSVLHRIFGSR